MEELYPFPNNDLEDMFLLASLKCQLMFGDYNPDVHVPGWIWFPFFFFLFFSFFFFFSSFFFFFLTFLYLQLVKILKILS